MGLSGLSNNNFSTQWMKTLEMPYEAEEEKNSEYIGVEKDTCERCGVSCKMCNRFVRLEKGNGWGHHRKK